MRYAVVRGRNETVARSRTSESAHRASRRRQIAESPNLRVVEMNQAVGSSTIGTVRATLAGQKVVFQPKGYLGGDLFNIYRFATGRDAPWVRDVGNVAQLGVANAVIQRLRDRGFVVEVPADLASALASAASLPVAEESKSRGDISVTRRGQQVAFEARGYLGRDAFPVYREAITGAKYDGKNANLASFHVAVGIIKKLVDAGFSVDIDAELVEVLKSLTKQVQQDVSGAKVRAEELDARLRAKGLSLFGFQKEGIAWLSGRHNALLFDEQGLGKTVSALVSLPTDAPVVVVCPASVKGVWQLEVAKWRPEFKVTILSGRNSFRWPEPGEIVVTNFDILSAEIGAAPPGTVVIGDEIQKVRAGTKTQRGARFRILAKAARDSGGRSWGLTGTPMGNRPQELWNILSTFGLAEEAFGSWKQFVATFNGTPGEWGGYEWGTPRADAGEKLRRVSLRRVRKEVLPDLPTKVYQEIPVDLDPKTKRAIDKVLRDAGVDVEKIVAAIEEAHAGRRELPSFSEISAARAMLAEAKIPALLEMIETYEESEDPILVFSAHRAPVDVLGERPGWATIDGDVKPERRSEIVADFQAGKLKGVAITIKAGGTGLTLTRASTAIFVDKMWTNDENEQAEDRLCRISQTRGCNIKEMVGDHAIDRRVHELLAKKRKLVDASIGASSVVHVEEVQLEDVDFDALARVARAEIEVETERAIEKIRGEVQEKRRVAAVRRPAQNETEEFAANAMIQLSQLDPDRAQEVNAIGFNKVDGPTGHWLAQEIESGQGLTDNQWRLAKKLALRYKRQVGEMPVETKGRWLVDPDSGAMIRALTPGDVINWGADPDAAEATINGRRYLVVDGWSYSARR